MTATETKTLSKENCGCAAPSTCETQTQNQTQSRTRRVFTPRADIYETKDSVVIVADVPGVDEKHLDITLEKNVLTIKGSVEPKAPEGYVAAYKEYHEGDYARAFTLGEDVDRNNIQASIKNGVLKVVLGKVGPVAARKIEVK